MEVLGAPKVLRKTISDDNPTSGPECDKGTLREVCIPSLRHSVLSGKLINLNKGVAGGGIDSADVDGVAAG